MVEAVFPGLRHAYVVQPDDPRNGVPLTEIIRLLMPVEAPERHFENAETALYRLIKPRCRSPQSYVIV